MKTQSRFSLVALVAALSFAGCSSSPSNPPLPKQESYLVFGSPAGDTYAPGDEIWVTWSGEGLTTTVVVSIREQGGATVWSDSDAGRGVNVDGGGGGVSLTAPTAWSGKTLFAHYEVLDKFGHTLTTDGTAFWVKGGSAATGG